MDISYVVQCPIRRFIARSHTVSKARDRVLKCSYRFEIRQQHCRSACQISERLDNSKYKPRCFKTLLDLIISLIGYRYRALISVWSQTHYYFANIGNGLSAYPEWFCVAHRWPVIFFYCGHIRYKRLSFKKTAALFTNLYIQWESCCQWIYNSNYVTVELIVPCRLNVNFPMH